MIIAESYKRGWIGMQKTLGECAGGSSGGACGSAGWGGAIVRERLNSFGDTFGAVPRDVDAVTSVVVRVGSEIPTFDTVGGTGATVDRCFMENDAGAGGC